MPSRPALYYITDRTQIVSGTLETRIAAAIAAGVDWVQIREKDLPARTLFSLAESAARQACQSGNTRVVVNDRLDVALAAKAHGVHLGTRSMPVNLARKIASPDFVIGASCHSLEEARTAQGAGADYIILGPIFPTPSKLQYGPPLGLETLRDVTSHVSIPVFAVGGVTLDRTPQCLHNGAAGIAAIRLFQESDSMEDVIRELRSLPAG